MKKYYAYTRVSTAKQGEGVSLQEQKEAIERYALHNGLTIFSWLEEKETAAKRGRRVFTEMLSHLKKRKADGVIIHKIDRSARNLKDWADLGELLDKGVEVHFSHESLDMHSRGGRLAADIQAVVAADFIRNLREETRKGFYGRLKQGLYPLPAPLGYLDQGKGKPKVPDPERAHLVKKAFELYGTGRFGYHRLLAELHRLGLRNKRGGRLSLNGISTVLNNPFYTGIIRIKKTRETYSGIHKPLISVALFDQVQAILSGKTNARLRKHAFLFRRFLRCRNCNSLLTGETQKGFTYYRCHKKECPTTCIKEEAVERTIEKALSPIELSDSELTELLTRVASLEKNWERERETAINTVRVRIGDTQEKLDRLTDAYIDRLIEKDIFEERRTALIKEKKTLEEKQVELRDETETIPRRMGAFFEQAKSVRLSYISAFPEEKRNLLEDVTSNRLAEGKKVAIELHSPFQELANRPKIACGDPCSGTFRTTNAINAKLANCDSCSSKFQIEMDKLFKKLLQYFTSQEGVSKK